LIKRGSILARTLHKWSGLLLGLQLLIWLATGVYMVEVDIDFIHGDSLVKNMQQTVALPDSSKVSPASLLLQFPDAKQIGLRSVLGESRYLVTTQTARLLIDPDTGATISPLNEKLAREIAIYHFKGDADIVRASLIQSSPPMEIQTRQLPLWRIDFDDRFSTSFYVDPYSGQLITRRHQYWRIFDFMWMLHIMDYDERVDAHNPLLIIAEVTGLLFAITGLWLLFYSFSGRRNKKAIVE
jgi:hypothetical protein